MENYCSSVVFEEDFKGFTQETEGELEFLERLKVFNGTFDTDLTESVDSAEITVDKVEPLSDIRIDQDRGNNDNKKKEKAKLECNFCGREFPDRRQLLKHCNYLHAEGERPHKCDHCDKRFVFPSDLRRHAARHNQSKEYQCQLCGISFGYHASLNNHIRHHHLNSEEQFQCNQCPAKFGVLANFKRHVKVHTNNRTCSQCGKVCHSEYHLSVHAMVHMNGPCRNCPYCNVAFIRTHALNKHIQKVHGREIKERGKYKGNNDEV